MNCFHLAGVRAVVVMAQIRWMARSTFVPHNRTVWSELPLARVRPSGLNATATTRWVCPVKVGSSLFQVDYSG